MKLDNQTERSIEQGIKTICKTAIVVRDTLEEEGQELIDRFDRVVKDITLVYAMDTGLLSKYRDAVSGIIKADDEEITPSDAVKAQNMIFDFCDSLADPKQIMEYVRTACEIVDVWNI